MRKISAFLFNTSVDSHISHPQHSVAVTLSRISGGRTQSGSWTKSCLCLFIVLYSTK